MSDLKLKSKFALTKGNKMKKMILAMALIFVALQAEDVVHYDKKETKQPQISKPNYPSDTIHPEK